MKICSLYGAGFYYIPGTDTCIKFGGWVRVEVGLNGGDSGSVNNNGAAGRDNRLDTNYAPIRTRFVVSVDTRTQTEYGTLRSYTRAGMQRSTQDYNQGGTYFERAFVQLAGWTFGMTQSFFDFMGGAFSYSGYYGGYSNTGAAGTNVFAYTAQFGNGLTATLAAEDASLRWGVINDTSQALVVGTAPGPTALTFSSYPGGGANPVGTQAKDQMPDIVANLRADQAWGSAQIAGAVHQLNALQYGLSTTSLVHPDTAYAWAVAGGVSVNLPWAKGDRAFVEATYTKGAMCYVGMCQNGTQMAYDRWTSSSLVYGYAFDSVYGALGGVNQQQQLTAAWAITGGVEHYWQPNLRTSLYAAYTDVNYGSTANLLLCAQAVTTVAGGGALARTNCNNDFSELAIGSRTIWNPVPNLDVGLEVLYTSLNINQTGSFTNAINTGGRPAGTYTLAGSEGVLQGLFRIQRNFWP